MKLGNRASSEAPHPAALPESYHRARRALTLAAGLLLAWELIGVELTEAPLPSVNVRFKSPSLAPNVLCLLVVYFGARLAFEWYQSEIRRRRILAARLDYALANSIAVFALGVFGVQKALDAQIFDQSGQLGTSLLIGTTLSTYTFLALLRSASALSKGGLLALPFLIITVGLWYAFPNLREFFLIGIITGVSLEIFTHEWWRVPTLIGAALVRLDLTLRKSFASDSLRAALSDESSPCIIAFWHSHVLESGLLLRSLSRQGHPVAVIAPEGTGTLKELSENWGLESVGDGNAHKSLRAAHRALKLDTNVAIAVDGPRGPNRRAKAGVVTLAQLAEVPIIPIGWAFSDCWRPKSWDRLIVPKPFSRVACVAGEAITFEGDGVDSSEGASRVEERLNDVNAKATKIIGGAAKS